MSKLQMYSSLASDAIKEKLSEFKNRVDDIRSPDIQNVDQQISDDKLNIGKSKLNLSLSTTLQHETISTNNINIIEQEKALPRCVLFEPGFEKLHQIPTKVSKRQAKKLKQLEKSKTKGKGWFDMPIQEMTEEKLNDLKIIQMRGVLNPKHFYKKTDIRPGVLPKFFQTGSVVETSADFYSGRIPKKRRKKTLVDELLNDAEFKRYKKRKYTEIAAKTISRKKKRHKNFEK